MKWKLSLEFCREECLYSRYAILSKAWLQLQIHFITETETETFYQSYE
jgi:hypothetical protein